MVIKTILHVVLSTMLNTGQFPEHVPHQEVACLTEAIFFEAKSESTAGKEAVANVIINRVNSGLFRDSICGVTNQSGQFQFKRAGMRKVGKDDARNAEESALVALRVLQGEVKDNTMGALFFLNRKIATHMSWLKGVHRTAVIGHHTFYKPKGDPYVQRPYNHIQGPPWEPKPVLSAAY